MTSRSSIAFIAVVFVWLGGCTSREQPVKNDLSYEDGLVELQSENFIEAYEVWRPLAEAGDVHAQFGLGSLYLVGGLDDSPNFGRAMYWFLQAAEQGHADAAAGLAALYESGANGGRDYDQAFDWFSVAATGGNVLAYKHLGFLTEQGHGADQSRAHALMWYLLGSQAGDEEAHRLYSLLQRESSEAELAQAAHLSTLCREQQFSQCNQIR